MTTRKGGRPAPAAARNITKPPQLAALAVAVDRIPARDLLLAVDRHCGVQWQLQPRHRWQQEGYGDVCGRHDFPLLAPNGRTGDIALWPPIFTNHEPPMLDALLYIDAHAAYLQLLPTPSVTRSTLCS
jgi:hypothetical protein